MKWSFVALLSLFLAAPPRGTTAEAHAMLEKAVAHYNAAGRSAALKNFTGGKAPWRDRDLYVACVSNDGLISANAAFPTLVGSSADVLKDAEGKPVGHAIIASAASGRGSLKYRWTNPTSGKTEWKTFYTAKLAKDVCGVGVYSAE